MEKHCQIPYHQAPSWLSHHRFLLHHSPAFKAADVEAIYGHLQFFPTDELGQKASRHWRNHESMAAETIALNETFHICCPENRQCIRCDIIVTRPLAKYIDMFERRCISPEHVRHVTQKGIGGFLVVSGCLFWRWNAAQNLPVVLLAEINAVFE